MKQRLLSTLHQDSKSNAIFLPKASPLPVRTFIASQMAAVSCSVSYISSWLKASASCFLHRRTDESRGERTCAVSGLLLDRRGQAPYGCASLRFIRLCSQCRLLLAGVSGAEAEANLASGVIRHPKWTLVRVKKSLSCEVSEGASQKDKPAVIPFAAPRSFSPLLSAFALSVRLVSSCYGIDLWLLRGIRA